MTKSERDAAIDLVLGQVRPVVVAAVDAAIGNGRKAAPKAAPKATAPKATPKVETKAPAIVEAPAPTRTEPVERHFVAELVDAPDVGIYGAVRMTRWISKKGQLVPVKSMTVPEEDLEYLIDILIDAQRRKETRQPVAA